MTDIVERLHTFLGNGIGEDAAKEIESLRQQLAEAEALRVCADHDANELARQLTEYQARDKVRIRYLELIANVNAMDYEYKSWARAALDIPAEKFK